MPPLTLPLPIPAAPDKPRPRRCRPAPLVVDARRLARLLGVGIRSIRTWDYAAKLPRAVKLGTRTVWILDEIRAWLRAGAPPRDEWEAQRNGQG